MDDLYIKMLEIGRNARQASKELALLSATVKQKALHFIAEAMLVNQKTILEANRYDLERAVEKNLSPSMCDRLVLNEKNIREFSENLHKIADLKDPIGEVIAQWQQPNGLKFSRVRTPLGVIGMIYESRPNVTIDAGALCLKTGNAVILRSGSDALHSSTALHRVMLQGLKEFSISPFAVQLIETADRMTVGYMLSGLEGNIDVLIPRGGKGLVTRVQEEARVPVFAHLEGICHIYVDKSADIEKAKAIIVNAKMRRTGICGAAETLLIDCKCSKDDTFTLLKTLHEKGCEIRGTVEICQIFPEALLAQDSDFGKEFLAPIIAVKFVEGVEGAITHIDQYSSHHTESIIAEDKAVVEIFFRKIDSAILLHNASTQYADGGEFGFGAEIGIATGKMHARGPIGIEQLTSFKYHIYGDGHIRP